MTPRLSLALVLAAALAPGRGGAQSWLTGPRPAPTAAPPSTPPEVERPRPDEDQPQPPPPPRLARLEPGDSLDTGASIWSLAVIPGRTEVAVAQADSAAVTYDLRTGQARGARRWNDAGRVLAVATTPRRHRRRGRGLAVGGDLGKVFVSGRGGYPAGYFQPDGAVWGLAFSPDGAKVAAVGEFDGVREWPLGTGPRGEGRPDLGRALVGDGRTHSDLRYSPDGTRVYVGTAHRDPRVGVRVLDATDHGRGEVARWEGHTQPVRGLDLSADGRWLATGSYDRSLRLWDTRSGEGSVLATFDEDVNGVAFAPHGRWVVAGIDDGTLAVVSVPEGETWTRFTAHRGHISAVAVTPDGRRILSGGLEPLVRTWETTGLPGR